MRQRCFVIGDTHFGHAKIITFEPARFQFRTIEEHDETLIYRWNSVVNKRDTVWHLGGVLFGRHSFAVLPRLNGFKKLVMGNHDQYPIALYAEHFTRIFGAAQLSDCILTHVPVHESQFHRYRANIHGHLHSKTSVGQARTDRRYACSDIRKLI